MSTETMPFKYEAAMQTFLTEMEWTDDTLEYDFENQFVYLNTPITIT